MNVQNEIDSLEKEIEKLSAKLRHLKELKKINYAKAYIAFNGITLDNIEFSDKNKPWFGHIRLFVSWIKENKSQKTYAEWNTRLYRVNDLLAGKMIETGVSVDDVEKFSKK